MLRERVELMWSTIAASVVDLPEPVVPVSSTIPRSSSASVRITSGQAEVVDGADLERDRAAGDRDGVALAEGVDAEAREAGDRVGEVGLADALELLEQLRVLDDLAERALGVLGFEGLGALDRAQLAVDADHRRRRNLDVQIRALVVDQVAQRFVDVEHQDLYRVAGRGP